MTKVRLITVGALKEEYLRSAFDEYRRRLGAFCTLEEINLREERIPDENDPARIRRALAAEGKEILERIPTDAVSYALCIEGKQLSSEELAASVGAAVSRTGKLCFIIGSSHGLSDEVKAACQHRLSFSRLTFPHQLMRVILAESLYRSFSILAGKRYHK